MSTAIPMPVHRSFVLLVALAMALGAIVPVVVPVRARAASATLVLSQVYGGGGNTGAQYTHDFLEIFNRSGAPVSLDGLSLQYASATGTGNLGANSGQLTELSGSIPAGGYRLVQEAAGAGNGFPLPTPDVIDATPINMSGTAGKVALVTGPTGLGCNGGSTACTADQLARIIDLVGYGTANFFEGPAAAPTLSNTTAAVRAEGGCTDTDNNLADFAAAAPVPRNAATPVDPCDGPPADGAPSVTATTPANDAAGIAATTNIDVTFSEAVDVAAGWYAIGCTVSGTHAATESGGPTTFQLDPTIDFTAGETCTVTIEADLVTDADVDDPPDAMAADHAFSFTILDAATCGEASHLIHDVQGSGLTTPINGATVTVEGVVVGDYQGPSPALRGFFLQEEDADTDADPLTSEGIFVFDGNGAVAVAPGDVVNVTGRAAEFGDVTQLSSVTSVIVCASGASVSPAQVTLPVATIGDWERWEGMLADFTQTMTVTENFSLGRFGEVVLSSTGRQFQGTHVTDPGPAAEAVNDLNARTRIVLDDANTSQNADPTRYPTGGLSASNTLRTGATVADLSAVVHQGFGSYRLQPVGPIAFDGASDRPTTPPDVGGRIQVAAFNVLNYFNGDGMGGGFPTSRGAINPFEFERQRTKIIEAIAAMDAEVVGLMEIENDGADANPAIADLVAGLNDEAGAGTYAYVDTGVIGTDEITVAIIYQPEAVSPLGAFAILASSVDPRFDDTLNRPALAQTFTETATGAAFTVAVNHLKSKGSDCGGAPDDQPEHLGGNCNGTRTSAADALGDWLATDPTGSGDGDSIIIGDLNSYRNETPIAALEDDGFTDLHRLHEGDDAYSYVFEGASGYLDHALSNASLTEQVADTATWHINTDEPPVLDYTTTFKSANHVVTLYAPDAFRSSDHDPLLIGLDLATHAPVITSLEVTAGPVEVGDPVDLSASYTDLDGGETHVATVDWGDGTIAAASVDQAADTVAATHAYTDAGLYTVTLTVSDGTLEDSATHAYVVVVDPDGGSVVGAGIVNSPDRKSVV